MKKITLEKMKTKVINQRSGQIHLMITNRRLTKSSKSKISHERRKRRKTKMTTSI